MALREGEGKGQGMGASRGSDCEAGRSEGIAPSDPSSSRQRVPSQTLERALGEPWRDKCNHFQLSEVGTESK